MLVQQMRRKRPSPVSSAAAAAAIDVAPEIDGTGDDCSIILTHIVKREGLGRLTASDCRKIVCKNRGMESSCRVGNVSNHGALEENHESDEGKCKCKCATICCCYYRRCKCGRIVVGRGGERGSASGWAVLRVELSVVGR